MRKLTFAASLAKVEKSVGKLPKAQIEVWSTKNPSDDVLRSATDIAAELMEMTGNVIITVEPAQATIEVEEEEPEETEGQLSITVAAKTGEILSTTSDGSAFGEAFVASAEYKAEQRAKNEEAASLLAASNDFVAKNAEANDLLAATGDSLMEDAGILFDEPTPEEAEEEAEAAESAFVIPESDLAPAFNMAAGGRLWPTEANILLNKARDGQIGTRNVDGVRCSAYMKNGALMFEMDGDADLAALDASTFFAVAGLTAFTTEAVGKATVFTGARFDDE